MSIFMYGGREQKAEVGGQRLAPLAALGLRFEAVGRQEQGRGMNKSRKLEDGDQKSEIGTRQTALTMKKLSVALTNNSHIKREVSIQVRFWSIFLLASQSLPGLCRP